MLSWSEREECPIGWLGQGAVVGGNSIPPEHSAGHPSILLMLIEGQMLTSPRAGYAWWQRWCRAWQPGVGVGVGNREGPHGIF